MLMVLLLPAASEHWNTHRIRRSRYDTVSGRPDSLYYLPELHGVNERFLLPVGEHESNYVRSHIIESDYQNCFQDYFRYVSGMCHLGQPAHWNEVLDLYNTLLQYAYNENE